MKPTAAILMLMWCLTASAPPPFTPSARTGLRPGSQTASGFVGRSRPAPGSRFVAMVSPTAGETFTAPATLRLIAAAHDPGVFINSPRDGLGGNATRVRFFVDDSPVLDVHGSDAEYYVFKGFAPGLAAGRRRVWARAFYGNPAEVLDSEPVAIDVGTPPVYGRVLDLQKDLTLPRSGYELIGTPAARIRVNGNGHRIVSPPGGSGSIVLQHVDFFDVGDRAAPSTPGIDVIATRTVVLENCTFDSSNPLRLAVERRASARVRGNTWRSNMRQPLGQNPDDRGSGASFPVVVFRGASLGTKVVQGNNAGAGWWQFESTRSWLIGGDAPGDGNVLIGPRAGIVLERSEDIQLRGNYSHHVYFGGWSQGNNFELGGAATVTVEHNVIDGGSWPVRGVGGEFRYNLVLDAGHQWLWADYSGAHVHHNVFVGGDNDVGGIYLPYQATGVRIRNNTIDLGQGSRGSAFRIAGGRASLTSNLIINARPPAVHIDGGILAADFNLFWKLSGEPYSDGRAPSHDVHDDPRVTGFDADRSSIEESLVWRRTTSPRDVLRRFRSLYTPGPGSPVRGNGDPSAGAGSGIGAISGTADPDDRFGR